MSMILERPLIKGGSWRLVINSTVSLVLISLLFGKNLEAKEEKTEGEVISVNPEAGFFILSVGGLDGVEIGDALKIFTNGKEVGRGQIIEVRESVSAGEPVEPADLMVREGYKVKVFPKTKKEQTVGTPLFGAKRYQAERPSYEAITYPATGKELFNINVSSEPKMLYPFIFQVLRSRGYIITYSNRFAGVINASKEIGLSLPQELWADLRAAIDHKLLLTINIKGRDSFSSLIFNAFLEHSQKGKRVEGLVGQGSEFYRELLNMAGEIKRLAEAR